MGAALPCETMIKNMRIALVASGDYIQGMIRFPDIQPPETETAAPELTPCEIIEYTGGEFRPRTVRAIGEIPLTIILNGREVVTLLCTGKYPLHLAVGFLKSDAFLTSPEQVGDMDVEHSPERITVRVETTHDPWKDRSIERSVTSGCGKGTNFGRNVETVSRRRMTGGPRVSPENILALTAELHERSSLYEQTRGCHNSSLCTPNEMLIFREDIGRHNAIDMIVGECFFSGMDTRDKMIVSTGRVASEILLKTVRIGVPVLISTAVATSLSVKLARATGLTLVGCAGARGFRVYNDPGRIIGLGSGEAS